MESENKLSAAFASLEKDADVVFMLKVVDASSWVSLKNFIYSKSVPKKNSSLGFKAVKATHKIRYLLLIFLSLINFVKSVCRERSGILFTGAGSGLICTNGNIVDSYVPSLIASETGLLDRTHSYFLSAHDVMDFWRNRHFLWSRHVVIHSYLVAPWRALVQHVFFGRYFPSSKLKSAADTIVNRLEATGVHITTDEIVKLHYRFVAGYWFFRMAFALLKVRELYVVSAYSNSEQCAAARSMGARVIELQHGIIGALHRGYNYCTESSLLPTPNEVVVYDQFWKSELLNGQYFREHQIKICERVKYEIAKKEGSLSIGPYVVFTGQGLLEKEVISFLKEILKRQTKVAVVYVPHPTESMEYVNEFRKELSSFNHFLLAKDLGLSTERLVLDSVAHISIYSSCHFDAVALLGKTYVLDVMGGNLMTHYASTSPSVFVCINSADELLEEILSE